ncbi:MULTISPECIES: MarR family winged helix-turn-helix transcriptional regulator [unclassified Methylobacterium]|uniref:MarR family winged helix-turn-helix transcriptional regulator n=1 Tax=unclassified Methylobacterium TaxID=2615210 RepID=UPI001D0C841F|nr:MULTISPECIES: MarR family transcriptional regulator [unclassified Methylobacterium]MCC0805724.1 MarR family transcriptional regulator [Methylobacterium sp. W2]
MALKKSRLQLDDQLCFALYAATNAVVRAYRPLLGELGLTYPQYLVMLALWQDGSAPVHALAERLQLGSNAVTPLVDKLEAAGFVTRARGADRRVVFVVLTEAGISLEEKVSVAQQAVVCRTGLPEKDLGALRQELKDLTDRIAVMGLVPQDEPT